MEHDSTSDETDPCSTCPGWERPSRTPATTSSSHTNHRTCSSTALASPDASPIRRQRTSSPLPFVWLTWRPTHMINHNLPTRTQIRRCLKSRLATTRTIHGQPATYLVGRPLAETPANLLRIRIPNRESRTPKYCRVPIVQARAVTAHLPVPPRCRISGDIRKILFAWRRSSGCPLMS